MLTDVIADIMNDAKIPFNSDKYSLIIHNSTNEILPDFSISYDMTTVFESNHAKLMKPLKISEFQCAQKIHLNESHQKITIMSANYANSEYYQKIHISKARLYTDE
jgi:hypothetical protein